MNKRMTTLSMIAIGGLTTGVLTACGASGDAAESGDTGSYTVAQIRWDAGDIFFNGVASGEEEAASEIEADTGDRIELKTVAANDAGEQLNGLQQLITQGIDGVSLVPWRGESMVDVMQQLQDANIPVVVHNQTVPGSDAPFVAFDNVRAGELAGEAMLTSIEDARGADWAEQGGDIVLLRCDVTASFDIDRFAGYMQAIQPVLDENPGVEVVERADLGCQGEPARTAVADAITSAGAENILGVGSVDGTMAVGGAVPALRTGGAVVGVGEPDAVAVTSIDCSQPELDAIEEGVLSHCSEQPALAEGEMVMRLLHDMMSNESLEPSSGLEQVDDWEGKPWAPVEVLEREDIEGPWYQTQAFAVPADLEIDSADHWAAAGGEGE